jgi:hypothetical protein
MCGMEHTVHRCLTGRISLQIQTYKRKNIKKNPAIWFNKMGKANHFTPRYIHITVNGNNPQSPNRKRITKGYKINQEMKYQYIRWKKNFLNNYPNIFTTCTSVAFELGLEPNYC